MTPTTLVCSFRHPVQFAFTVLAAAKVLAASGRSDLRLLAPTALSYGSPDEAVHLDAVEALLAGEKKVMGPQGGCTSAPSPQRSP